MTDMTDIENKPAITRSEVFAVRDEEHGVAVVVFKSSHSPYPKYSFEVGFLFPGDAKVLRYRSARWAPEFPHALILCASHISEAVTKAEDWIDAALTEDRNRVRMDRQWDKEQAHKPHQAQTVRSPGKTAKKREKEMARKRASAGASHG
jgi:hypothetical protein